MAYQTIIVEDEEHVGSIRLNRPEALNALNSAMLTEIGDALALLDANPRVRAVVLTGSEKAFAAGADIKEMADKTFPEMFLADYFTPESEVIQHCRKPVIAAVAGYCLGGGCELAMMSTSSSRPTPRNSASRRSTSGSSRASAAPSAWPASSASRRRWTCA